MIGLSLEDLLLKGKIDELRSQVERVARTIRDYKGVVGTPYGNTIGATPDGIEAAEKSLQALQEKLSDYEGSSVARGAATRAEGRRAVGVRRQQEGMEEREAQQERAGDWQTGADEAEVKRNQVKVLSSEEKFVQDKADHYRKKGYTMEGDAERMAREDWQKNQAYHGRVAVRESQQAAREAAEESAKDDPHGLIADMERRKQELGRHVGVTASAKHPQATGPSHELSDEEGEEEDEEEEEWRRYAYSGVRGSSGWDPEDDSDS